MRHSLSSPRVQTKPFAYQGFAGLDSSRDITALETPKSQHLAVLNNGYCDWRGQIVRDPSFEHRAGERPVTHVRFFDDDAAVYVERTDAGLNFVSERGHALAGVHPSIAVVTSTVFNQRVQLLARARPAYSYDGFQFRRNRSQALDNLRPSFAAATQRRMAVAGIPGRETQVHISRVDDEEVWPDDEDEGSENVLRAGFIDIANMLGAAESITGLAAFEQSRLAIFTTARVLIYRIDPDINRWTIDESANINIGCISHNTIVRAGTDLIFCSRSGIHSITRSRDNGILVYSTSLSDKVDLLYAALLNSVEDPKSISAVFDQDKAQYHVFFPQPGGVVSKRLTLSLNPEGGQPRPAFSTGDWLNQRCADFSDGTLLVGTSGGVYRAMPEGQTCPSTGAPPLEIETPMLWHGSITDAKQTHSLTLQASGCAELVLDALDADSGGVIDSMVLEVDGDPDDGRFYDVPLSRQYARKWEHRYRGARYRIRSTRGAGLLRIVGLAIDVRT